MDIKTLRQIAEIFTSASLTELEITEGELNIKMKRESSAQPSAVQTVPSPIYNDPQTSPSAADIPVISAGHSDGATDIRSPLAGVFYVSASPELPPYAKVGSRVKKGDILCIIEAMKVMNEINAEQDGEIVEVCASNEELVEYNQTLFRIR